MTNQPTDGLLPIGERFQTNADAYLITRRLGSGLTSEVYQGESAAGVMVAIKVMREDLEVFRDSGISVPVLCGGAALTGSYVKKALGPETGVFILIVAVIGGLRWMPVARLVRAQFLSLREKEFVEAARSLGAPPLRQVVRHILPNSIGPVIVAGTIDVAAAIIAESTLSFLGLGFPPDIPTWGRILFDAKDNLDFAPHWAIFPGTAIFLTVLSINYIGDGLRDALDPRKVLGK